MPQLAESIEVAINEWKMMTGIPITNGLDVFDGHDFSSSN